MNTYAILAATITTIAAHAATLPVISGRQLLYPGDVRFQLRGVAYSPTPIGENPANGVTSRYLDARLMERDGPLLADLGANTIRIFEALRVEADGNASIGISRAFLQAASRHGLWVVAGTFIDPATDFSNPARRQSIVAAHQDLVREFKDVPNILMWAPGNEVNFFTTQLGQWNSLLNEIAAAIKTEQGGAAGPGFGPYVCGINNFANNPAIPGVDPIGLAPGDTIGPAVDIWAVNVFNGPTFGALFKEAQARTAKPFWIAEAGIDSFNQQTGASDETSQAAFARALWRQVEAHNQLVFGADAGFYSDEWWKAGNPLQQDAGGSAFGLGPDNFMNEEHLGIVRIEAGEAGNPDQVQFKAAWSAIKETWSNGTPEHSTNPVPFMADFNAVNFHGHTFNNYSGFHFGIYGSEQDRNDAAISLGADITGFSGRPGDRAFHATGSLTPGSVFTFFSLIFTLFPDTSDGFDFRAFDTIRFKARIGTATAHPHFRLRLEDSEGAQEFNNVSQPILPQLTTAFQTFEFPLAAFTSGSQPVNLQKLAQIVIDADTSGNPPATYELDLILDDLEIVYATSRNTDHRLRLLVVPLPGERQERRLLFQTSSDREYIVEYKDSLASPTWIPLPGLSHSSGSVVDRRNVPFTFYRLREMAME